MEPLKIKHLLIAFWLFILMVGPVMGDLLVPGPLEASSRTVRLVDAPKVNINTADIDELLRLRGVGIKTAEDIVSYRQKNGPFRSAESLIKIKGIGGKRLEKFREQIELR
jgi:competence ComEA-like helix-hairpin-helix protein